MQAELLIQKRWGQEDESPLTAHREIVLAAR